MGNSQLLPGAVLRPDEPEYASAIRPWNGMVDKRPALVVQPDSAADVAAAIGYAIARGLPLSVRGGGHHIAGTSLVDGGLTIDMSRMTAVDVDPDNRTATAGGGCRLRDVDRATQRHGLAVPLGFVSNVGVGGLTLGGGLGYLTRRFGWTVDNLLEVEIVTADGQIRRASHDEHPDLFWGVRGAGANLGVVTRLTYRLHPVGPLVHGGLIAWPFERAAEITAAYRQITAEAPRELAAWLLLVRGPEAPFVPVEWHGRRLCVMAVCYSGGSAGTALAPIRALGTPVFDMIGERPYADVQSYLDDTEPVGMHHHWRTEYLATLDDGLLKTLCELFEACPIPLADLGILHLSGALNEHAEDDGAVGNRDARYVVGVNGMWEPGDPDEERFRDWIRAGGDRVRPFGTGRTYVNFQTEEEPDARVRAAYGTNYPRLAALKHRYDPENLFRSNRNVRPDPIH